MKTSTKSLKGSSSKKKTIDIQKTTTLATTILILVVLQLIVSLFMIFSTEYSAIPSKTIEKIDNLDAFFAANAPGYGSAPSNEKQSVPENTQSDSQVNGPDSDDDPWIGNENAKVTVIEFSDYQCPFCRKYWTESYPQLKKEFIDTGKIKYVFRDFPLPFHKSAKFAAKAANCIREQKGNDAYFEFHNIIFAEQNKQGVNTIDFTEKDVLSWVNQMSGINADEFTTCYNDPKQDAEIEADITAGTQAGVSGTPTFFINGKMLVGSQPYSAIKAEIEKALES
jgi:protein-disulfide isomerase